MKALLITTLLTLFCSTQAFSQEDNLDLSSEWTEGGALSISTTLYSAGTYSIAIMFTRMENFSISKLYFTSVSASSQILLIKPTDPNKPMGVAYKYIYMNGPIAIKPDISFVYLLPFSPTKQKTAQDVKSMDEKYETVDYRENWRMLSFNMEKGDTVHAVRKGKVVEITDKYLPTEYKVNVSYTSQSNKIIVEHPDGTICHYGALEKGSMMVKVGDIIYPGDPIAKAGTYNNKDYQLRLGMYYIKANRRAVDLNNAFDRMYIDPVFATTRGDIKLIEREKYTSIPISDQIRQKEMTKKEIKSLSKS